MREENTNRSSHKAKPSHFKTQTQISRERIVLKGLKFHTLLDAGSGLSPPASSGEHQWGQALN